MFCIKKDLSDDIQKLAESQKRTHESLRDLDETMATKTSELATRLKEFTDRCCMLAGKKFAHIITTQTAHSESLDEIAENMKTIAESVKNLNDAVRDLSRYLTQKEENPTHEDLVNLAIEKTEQLFQKLNQKDTKYGELVKYLARSVALFDNRKFKTLPISQLSEFIEMCDKTLHLMELCE